jgi:ribonuclease J
VASLRLIPLGGLGEIGLNALVVECAGTRLLVDCGLMFAAGEAAFGVDRVVPDFAYLGERPLDAVLLTHGHEDHTGALPQLLAHAAAPVYGTPFTLGLASSRLKEAGIDVDLREWKPGDRVRIKDVVVEPVRSTHSVPEAVGLALETPAGIVVHTGDFKIDAEPVDGLVLDEARLRALGREGVAVLLSDSTNAEHEGATRPEGEVGRRLAEVIAAAPGRVYVALFASHVHRVREVVEAARAAGRVVALAGRSLHENVELAQRLGHLPGTAGAFIPLEDAALFTARELCVIATGAQAEPRAALSRLAAGELEGLPVEPGDTVVFSSRVIPGNAAAVARLMDELVRRGATLLHGERDGVHTSGHALRDELRRMLDWTRPRNLVPVHGEHRMLARHAELAQAAGARACLASDGDVLKLSEAGELSIAEAVPAGRVFLGTRANGAGALSEDLLRERRLLGRAGVVVATLVVDRRTREVLRGPDLNVRGVPGVEPGSETHALARTRALEAIAELSPEMRASSAALEDALQKGVRRAFRRENEERPLVVPVVVEA